MNKRILFLAVALMAMLSVNAQSIKGDMNNDDKVDVSDVTAIVDCILHPVNIVKPVTAITLSSTTLDLEFKSMAELTATVEPSDATLSDLLWNSSNASVALVYKGYVVAVGPGTATITATASDGSGVSASCEVTVVRNYEYIDLGLPGGTLWATCNVGADEPYEFGSYFAWGDVQGSKGSHTVFNRSTYSFSNDECRTFSKYVYDGSWGTIDNKKTLEAIDDAATQLWGADWRMPTKDEWDILCSSINCTFTWFGQGNTEFNGVAGMKITSRANGNFIFLPAAGLLDESGLTNETVGAYWTATVHNYENSAAWAGYFSTSNHDAANYLSRYQGLSVRPVAVKTVPVSAITLSETSMELPAGSKNTLIATVTPSYAPATSLTWETSDASVATVANGVVTALHRGTATITATATDGSGVSASCEVTVTIPYVDLGLPGGLLWASCNVGANEPYEYGDYFAWGDVQGYNGGHTDFTWDTCPLYSNGTYMKYSSFGDGKRTLEAIDDAATQQWGAGWRMPTKAEWDNLNNSTYCTWTWYSKGNSDFHGIAGWKVTSKTNGNFIFIPAGGIRVESNLQNEGTSGSYWTSSLYEQDPDNAWYRYFTKDSYSSSAYSYYSRFVGMSIRPVKVQN